ncbi:hypothetical protein [Streptomyces cinereoruber]|uniref:hypothetical protein n=1 Tax=Streptomyces cinereoruber TaxID=67260 RepID=UPI0036383C2D
MPQQQRDHFVEKTSVEVTYVGGAKSTSCLPPGVRINLGYNDGISEGQPGDMTGPEFGSARDIANCTNYEDVIPRDRLQGKVVVERHSGEGSPTRPLANAKWELWYKGKAGKENDAVIDRPVLKSFNSETWEPSGDPLTGYLNANGEFDDKIGPAGIEFIYPQTYNLRDGTDWHGCETDSEQVLHLQGYACKNENLYLKIFADDGKPFPTKIYIDDLVNTPMSMATIELGHHFERTTPEQRVYEADSGIARAYGGILNVQEVLQATNGVELEWSETEPSHQNATGFVLNSADAHSAVPERLAADDIRGVVPSGCPAHNYSAPVFPEDPTSTEAQECAFGEGVATFIAVAAENDPGSTAWQTAKMGPTTWHNIESERPTAGRDENGLPVVVEGNVAGILWDLYDGQLNPAAPDEAVSGYRDRRSNPLLDILSIAGQGYQPTLNEFREAWFMARSGDTTDLEIFWLNETFNVATAGPSTTLPSGWVRQICNSPGLCVGAAFDYLPAADAESSDYRWQLPMQDVPYSENYDVYALIPDIDNLDPEASYTLRDSLGTLKNQWIVNQADNRGRWVRLNDDAPLTFGPNNTDGFSMHMSRGSNLASTGKHVGANGLVIVPRYDY